MATPFNLIKGTNNPILVPTNVAGSPDRVAVRDACFVITSDGTFNAIYTGFGGSSVYPGMATIRLSKAAAWDGPYGAAVTISPSVASFPANVGSIGLADPFVVFLNGQWHMWVSIVNPNSGIPYRYVGHLTAEGTEAVVPSAGWVFENSRAMSPLASGWTSEGVAAPKVYAKDGGGYIMLFCGWGSSAVYQFQVGYATSSSLNGPWVINTTSLLGVPGGYQAEQIIYFKHAGKHYLVCNRLGLTGTSTNFPNLHVDLWESDSQTGPYTLNMYDFIPRGTGWDSGDMGVVGLATYDLDAGTIYGIYNSVNTVGAIGYTQSLGALKIALPPPVTIDSPLASTSGASTITGTRTSGYTAEGVSGATFGAVTYPTATTWSMGVSDLLPGNNYITVRAMNGAAEAGSATVNVRYELGLDFSAQPAILSPTDDGAVISYGTFDHQAEDLETIATSFASAQAVAVFREAASAVITSGATATSTKQMLEAVFTTAQATVTANSVMQQVEAALAQITAFPTVQDILNLADQITAPFIFTAQPSVSMLTGDGGIIAYGTADTGADDVTSAADVATSVADLLVRVEQLLTTVQAVPSVADVMAQVEAVASSVQAEATANDVRITGVAESLLTAANALATAADVQMMVNGVTTVALNASSTADVAAYLENLIAVSNASATVTDVLTALLDVGPHVTITLLSPINLRADMLSPIQRVVYLNSPARIN